eukprot:6657120-Alexandrium_andersonii.AAC.1
MPPARIAPACQDVLVPCASPPRWPRTAYKSSATLNVPPLALANAYDDGDNGNLPWSPSPQSDVGDGRYAW